MVEGKFNIKSIGGIIKFFYCRPRDLLKIVLDFLFGLTKKFSKSYRRGAGDGSGSDSLVSDRLNK